METVGRFAPSPSGRLHLGNLLCALLVWLSARQKDDRVLLRVEDLDTARCPRRYSEQMERDLNGWGWIGTSAPEGDNGTGPYYQSQRTEIYQAALETLGGKGPCLSLLLYPGGASRCLLSPGGRAGGLCRDLPSHRGGDRGKKQKPRPGPPADNAGGALGFTDGLHVGRYEENQRQTGDFLLRRSDGMFAYQLAVVVDDAAMGVTEVVRGADLLDSTPASCTSIICWA